ncbi:MAG: outer membrane protein assembly factor BamE (lipoprotein component of BamABCDE complex) [Halioglobus sp.]|jgi:outer membrane protein assembly factor BamE (lipoprotein component of BamABCDE complex)
MLKPVQILAAVLLLPAFLSGCAQYESKRGVAVVWQADAVSQLIEGKSTRADVLDLLGPPSQVIALGDETVFYYLFEHSKGEGLVLIVYNRMKIDTQYDRAIFFFDDNDVLTESATHIQAQ